MPGLRGYTRKDEWNQKVIYPVYRKYMGKIAYDNVKALGLTLYNNIVSGKKPYTGLDQVMYSRMKNTYPYARKYAESAVKEMEQRARQFNKNKMLRNSTMPRTMRRRRTYRPKKTRSSKYTQQQKGTQVVSKRRTYRRKVKKPLSKQVKEIKKQLNQTTAKHTYKQTAVGVIGCALQLCDHDEIRVNGVTENETFIANLRYYDPSVPGTLVTASGATGTFNRDINIANVYGKLELKNNYQFPLKVKVYLVKPKGDTSIAPVTYYNNGITDQVINPAADDTTALLYLNDIEDFRLQWSCKCLKDVTLDAGASLTVTHNTGSYRYDPSLTDTHTLEYQPKYKAFSFIVRTEGTLVHSGSAGGSVTTGAGELDYMLTRVVKMTYDAGVYLDDIYLSENRASTSTGPVYTSKPVADNIYYSVS